MEIKHKPVLLKEILEYLAPQPNQNFVDCTFGAGGHGLAILERIKPNGKLIGIEWDLAAWQEAKKNNAGRKNLILVNDNYKNLRRIINDAGINKINGVLLDLGLSSIQLAAESRGFSFQSKGFLDLRFNTEQAALTTADILKTYQEEELIKIFKEYGQEPLARPLAREIIITRKKGQNIETADMLVQLVSKVYRKYFKTRSKKHPATRVFQALRIAVNDELGNLKSVLPQAIEILPPGGRLAVISFHSGEDRIVKHYFRERARQESSPIKILTKKPISPAKNEQLDNPRSRSAKLRVLERI